MITNRMKEYRAKYGMKQEDLARLVGVRRETIGNLEKGKYNPSLVLAWRIAKVFQTAIVLHSKRQNRRAGMSLPAARGGTTYGRSIQARRISDGRPDCMGG